MKTVIIFIVVVFFIFYICKQVYKFGKLSSGQKPSIPSKTGSISNIEARIKELESSILTAESRLNHEIHLNTNHLDEMRNELRRLVDLKNKYTNK